MFTPVLACFSSYTLAKQRFRLKYAKKNCALRDSEAISVSVFSFDVLRDYTITTTFSPADLYLDVPEGAGSSFGSVFVSSLERENIFYVAKLAQPWVLVCVVVGAITGAVAVAFTVAAVLYLREARLDQMRKDLDEELIRGARYYVYAEGDEKRILGEKSEYFRAVLPKEPSKAHKTQEVICII